MKNTPRKSLEKVCDDNLVSTERLSPLIVTQTKVTMATANVDMYTTMTFCMCNRFWVPSIVMVRDGWELRMSLMLLPATLTLLAP